MSLFTIPCPNCGANLGENSELHLVSFVPAEIDHEGRVKLDLLLACQECGERLNAFVPLDEFQSLGKEEAECS